MRIKTFHVIDKSGLEHEIMLENAVGRFYEAFKDGVKESFIKQCLSFDAAFREYCAQEDMHPISCKTPLDSKESDAASGDRRTQGPSDRSPADCLTTLEILHDLFKKEMISRAEMESLKTKIISYFSMKF